MKDLVSVISVNTTTQRFRTKSLVPVSLFVTLVILSTITTYLNASFRNVINDLGTFFIANY